MIDYNFNNYNYRANAELANVRILHASPDAPNVDIYINRQKLVTNFKFKQFTQYFPLPPGTYNISIYPTGSINNPILNKNFSIVENEIVTLAAVNMFKDIELMPIQDPILPKIPGKAYLRFINLSPNSPEVDLTLSDGNKLFESVGYKEMTEYIPLLPGNYTFQIRPSTSGTIILNVPNAILKPNRFYSIYAVGLIDATPPLQVLIPLDGNSYL